MNEAELKEAWNAQADKYDQWDTLSLDGVIAFAQLQECEACAKLCEAPIDEVQITDDCKEYRYALGDDLAEVLRMRHNTRIQGDRNET